MSALIVRLPAQPPNASTELDYALSLDGSSVQSHGSAQTTLLPAAGRAGAELVAVVPAQKLSWHRIELPKGTSAKSPRLRAVLEGMLEDQLLDDPETLHFALSPKTSDSAGVWVAACERVWLRDALQVLEQAGRPVSRIVPEFAPEGPLTLHAMGDAHQPVLVAASSDGVVCLPLSAQGLQLLPALAQDTYCVAEPAVAALAEQLLQRKPEIQLAAPRWLQAAQTDWDLAQFEFSSSGRARMLKGFATAGSDFLSAPAWRSVRWALVLLMLANLLGLNAWAWRERIALADKRDAIGRTLTQTFPQVKLVVDAPVQMEKEVIALRRATGAASSADLETMLGALSGALPSGRTVKSIDFTGGELQLKGLSLQDQEAQAVVATLKSQGYTATLQGETLSIARGGVQ